MSSEFGHQLKVSIFGQSHGKSIGVTLQGLPAGEEIDMDALLRFLARRAPGQNELTTPRKESDRPIFLSGLENNVTCGAPLCAVIENRDHHSADYQELLDKPRPGHADLTAWQKWQGAADMRGGGHFSGRLTAPLCIAGGIALQILAKRNIHIGTHLLQVGSACDAPFPLLPDKELLAACAAKPVPVLDDLAAAAMEDEIRAAAAEKDSVGGMIECAAIGLPAGLGGPMFDGVENRLSAAVFGIPGVKGIQFGAGFAACGARGSQHNDPIAMAGHRIVTATNHAGGILGGITNGMPLVFSAAFKPTPSIGLPQQTVSLSKKENTTLSITGRHDPCIALRAVPVVEAVTALVLLDMIMEEMPHGIN